MTTGGGEPINLSTSDKDILDIMCPEVVEGIQSVAETPVIFDFKVGSLNFNQNIYNYIIFHFRKIFAKILRASQK